MDTTAKANFRTLSKRYGLPVKAVAAAIAADYAAGTPPWPNPKGNSPTTPLGLTFWLTKQPSPEPAWDCVGRVLTRPQ